MSFSAISSLIFFNKALVSGEETSLELDGVGVAVEVKSEIESLGVVGYETQLEWRCVDSTRSFVA